MFRLWSGIPKTASISTTCMSRQTTVGTSEQVVFGPPQAIDPQNPPQHGFFLQMVQEVLGAWRGGGLLFCPVLTQSWDPLWLGAGAHTNNTGELGSMPLANTSMFTTRIHPGFRGHNTI